MCCQSPFIAQAPGLDGGLDLAIPPGDGEPVETIPDTPLNNITVVDNLIHKMHTCGISVLAFWPEPTLGRALQLYGLGPMVITGNRLVGGGLTGVVPEYEAHAVEIINLGQSPELISDGTMPSFYGFLPAPPIQGDPNMLDERLLDGRILYSNNQARLVVDGSPAVKMHCAFRLLSHGDIMMQGNQHVTTFDRTVGHLDFSTTAIGWSVNVSNNRSEDSHLHATEPGELITEISIITTGAMNITSSNIATRCILAFAAESTQVNTTPSYFSDSNIVYYRTDADNCSTYALDILYWLTFTPG